MRGEPVALSAREFALLEALLARPGAVLSRAQLEEKLYGWNEEVDSNAVEVHLSCAAAQAAARHDPQRARRGLDDRASRSDGAVTRVRSIRRELVVWLAAGLAVAVAAAAIATYLRAREEANEIFDYQLRQMAASLTGVPLAGTPGGIALGDDALVVQIWDRNGVQLFLSQPQQSLPQYAQLGFNTVSTASRRLARVQHARRQRGRAGRAADERAARARGEHGVADDRAVAARRAACWRFSSVWASRAASRRSRASPPPSASATPGGLEPVEEAGLPNEVRPLVHALNGLLARLDRALGAQRAFIADAAHELRTPLTAVHLQAQLAERAVDDDERRAALAELRAGLTRATHLVEQLLTLAREEPGVAERRFAPVNLDRAGAKRRRRARGDRRRAERRSRHGRRRGRSRRAQRPWSSRRRRRAARARCRTSSTTPSATRRPAAASTSPSIRNAARCGRSPSAIRARAFRRASGRACSTASIVRPPLMRREVPGSGLGLAIVKRIAERHEATISLEPGFDGPSGEGLTVTVRFPRKVNG